MSLLNKDQKKLIFLASLGGALEFYDFAIFGFLAKTLSELFFPYYDRLAALLATFTIFALGYLMRPLGGIIFGHYGDRYGRKRVFILSVLLMAIPTFLIGLLPTYQHIGISASLMLILLRLLQGLSVGGEVPGAIVYIAETAPAQHRGLICGFIFFGINLGLLLGSLIGSLLSHLFTEQQFNSWGWRLAFIFGGLLCLISYQLRNRLTETPYFEQLAQSARFPAKIALKHYKGLILKAIAITGIGAVGISLFLLYMPTYLATQLQTPLSNALLFNSINIAVFAGSVILMCYLTDIIGRKKVMLIGCIFFILASYPIFLILQQGNMLYTFIVGITSAIFISCITGSFGCMLAELFPTTIRYTGFALSFNIGIALFGGLTPLLVTSLIKATGTNLAPSFYIILCAILAVMVLTTLPETFNKQLD